MKKEKEHKNIFDVVHKERATSRAIASIKKVTPPSSAAQTIDTSLAAFNESWPTQVQQMYQELNKLKEQLRMIEKESGISLSGALTIPEHFDEKDKQLISTKMQQREENLKNLIVLPQFYKQHVAKEEREEKRQRMIRTVGKRKQWIPL